MQVLCAGGDSWVVVHALGHYAGKEQRDCHGLILEGVKSERNYTRLHSWTLYCILLGWYMSSSTNRSWKLTVMAIQHNHTQSCSQPSKNPARCLQWLVLQLPPFYHRSYIETIASITKLQQIDAEEVHLFLCGGGYCQSAQNGQIHAIWTFWSPPGQEELKSLYLRSPIVWG